MNFTRIFVLEVLYFVKMEKRHWGRTTSLYTFFDYVSKILQTLFWHKLYGEMWGFFVWTRGDYPISHIKCDRNENTSSI